MDLVVRASRAVIDGEIRSATVAVADGVIRAVGPIDADYPAAEQIRVADGTVLLPGFVDTHVHINEPGTDWEGFATATAAAAAGGITTLVDMPLDSDPVTTTVNALSVKQQAAQGNCVVDVAFWGGVIPGNLAELGDLAAAGVRGFKCFLTDSGNPNFPHLNADDFRRAVSLIAELDAVLLVHAESHQVIETSPRGVWPRLCVVSLVAARHIRGRRRGAGHRRRQGNGRAGARGARVQRPRIADAGRGQAVRRPHHRRDMSALSDLRGRRHPRRRNAVRGVPADSRGGQSRPAVAGACRWHAWT